MSIKLVELRDGKRVCKLQALLCQELLIAVKVILNETTIQIEVQQFKDKNQIEKGKSARNTVLYLSTYISTTLKLLADTS